MHDQDKTRQQLVEELVALRQQLADRQEIADNLPVVVSTAGLDGYYKEVNATFERILGWSEQESLSRPLMEFIHPDDHAAAASTFERLKAGHAVINFVDRKLCKDGSYRWFNWIVIPVPNREIVFGIGQDITERKQVEEALRKAHDELEERVNERTSELTAANEALRESEENFRTLVEMLPDAVLTGDLMGCVTFASRRALQMYGTGHIEDMLGRNPLDFFAPEDHQRFFANLRRTLEEGVTSDVEYDMVRKDGTRFVGEASAAAMNDMVGKPKGFVAILRDITQRKQAEAALRQSHDELQAIYDGMVEGLLVSDIETQRIMRANASICRMLGYSKEELRSLSIQDIHPAEALPDVLKNVRAVKKTSQTLPGSIPLLRKDGSIFYAEVIGKFLTYDGRPCSMGIFRDITERMQAEAALRQSHDELQAIYDQALEGIVIVDNKTANPIRANSAFCQLLGYTDESVHSISTEMLHPPEVLPTVLEYLDAVKEGSITRIDDLPFLRNDGSRVYVDVVSSSIRYNERPCWISFFHDVTERHLAREELERERQSLWNMLQASDHERQVIAYDIHDGLAQYLAAAGMQLQVYDSLKENSPDEARKAYETAVQLVHQAHSESRRLISEVRHPVIDEQGIETAITSLAYEQRQRGGPRIESHTSVEFDRLPPILENAIYRMVQEALTNACTHSKSTKVRVSLVQERQDLRVEVQDWGVGFDTQAIDQGHFGLESIRQRVRLLGGRLMIDSKPGSGTLVQVVVPILEKQFED